MPDYDCRESGTATYSGLSSKQTSPERAKLIEPGPVNVLLMEYSSGGDILRSSAKRGHIYTEYQRSGGPAAERFAYALT